MEKNDKKPTLSWSALAQYSRCPRMYFYQRIAHLPAGPKASALLEGTCGHAALQWFYTEKRDRETPSEKRLLDYFNDYWNSALLLEEADWSEGSPAVRAKAVEAALRGHYQNIAPQIEPDLVEQEWRIELPECSFDLAGVCDCVATDGSVADWKFYNKMPFDKTVHEEGQLTVYALARASGAFGQLDNYVDLPLYLGAAVKGSGAARLIPTLRGEKELLWFRRAIIDWAKAIEADAFFPNTQTWAHSPKWCDYWEHCNA